jgi:hypothetical protein
VWQAASIASTPSPAHRVQISRPERGFRGRGDVQISLLERQAKHAYKLLKYLMILIIYRETAM